MSREAELLSRIVDLGAVERAMVLVNEEHFIAFPEVWHFMLDYYGQFQHTPSVGTMQAQFGDDFVYESSEASIEWLADEVQSEHLERKIRSLLQEVTDANEHNPREAARIAREGLDALMPSMGEAVGDRIDLREHVVERIVRIEERGRNIGLVGLTTGLERIDEVTHGTQAGQIELIGGRPGDGKTWLLLRGLYEAWQQQGATVSLISPEMSAYDMGIRLDSFEMHVSQDALQSGVMDDDDWYAYKDAGIRWARNADHPGFFFRETGGLGRSFNTADIAAIIRRDNPAILGIDGLLFVEPVNRDFSNVRGRLTNVCNELLRIKMLTNVAIRITHQANRASDTGSIRRRSSLTIDELMPGIGNLAEADATGQFADRLITVKRIRGRSYFKVAKNRNGDVGRIVSAHVDIDRGYLTDERKEDGDSKLEEQVERDSDQEPEQRVIPF